MRIYYAHTMNTYDSLQEAADIQTLSKVGQVVNPNLPEHQEGCSMHGMEYFKDLVQSCDIMVYRPFLDGTIGAGIAQEIEWAEEKGMVVFEMPSKHGLERRILDVPQTRIALLESGRKPK